MKLVKHVANEFADRMLLFWDDIKYIPHIIRNGIVNMWQWRHIIWNDRDYDYAFIYDVLEFKLRKQMRYMKKRDRFVSTARSVEKMELACELIQRVRNDYYVDESFDYYNFEFDFVPIDDELDGKKLYEWKYTLLWEKYDDYLALYPRKAKQYADLDKDKAAHKIAMGNHKQAQRILFKLLDQNINDFWD